MFYYEKAQFDSLWFSADNIALKMVFVLSQNFLELLKMLQLLYGTLKTVHQLKVAFKAKGNSVNKSGLIEQLYF